MQKKFFNCFYIIRKIIEVKMQYNFDDWYPDKEDSLKKLSVKSNQIRAGISIKLLKYKLIEYITNYKMV